MLASILQKQALREHIRKLLREVAEDRARAAGASKEMIDTAKAIIESLPHKREEKYPTIQESYLDWITNIFIKNAKNKQKNIAQRAWAQEHNQEPQLLVEKQFFEVKHFQILIMKAYQETKVGKGMGLDLKQFVKLENFEQEAKSQETDVKVDIIQKLFAGWNYSAEFIETQKYEITNKKPEETAVAKKVYTHPWYKQRDELLSQIKGKLNQETILMKFDDGYTLVLLDTLEKMKREGHIQNLCLKGKQEGFGCPKEEKANLIDSHVSGYWNDYKAGNLMVISLRTPDNEPIATSALLLGNAQEPAHYREKMAKHDRPISGEINTKYFQPYLKAFLKNSTEKALEAFKKDGFKANKADLIMLARSIATPPDVLEELAKNIEDVAVISLLLQNDSLPPDIRKELVEKKGSREEKLRLARTSTDQELLVMFASDTSNEVRLAVASNERAHGALLHQLYLQNRQGEHQKEFRHEIARNQQALSSTLTMIMEDMQQGHTEETDIVKQVAGHRNAKLELLQAIFELNKNEYAAVIAQNVNAEHELLDKIADVKDDARYYVALNKNTKTQTLIKMLFDIDGNEAKSAATRKVILDNERVVTNANTLQYIIDNVNKLKANPAYILYVILQNKQVPHSLIVSMTKIVVNDKAHEQIIRKIAAETLQAKKA